MTILVAGAGIAGLGLARALRERDIATDVVERQQAWTHEGAGIYLPGNATRSLRTLGLAAAVAERGRVITRQRFCDHRGQLLVEINLEDLWGDVGQCLAVHRADLHKILATHGDPVAVRMGMPMRSLSQDDDAVTVEFGDGSTGRWDLVIGADGINSTVRQLIFNVDATRPVGQLAWRFVTECPPEVTNWTVFLGRGVTFLAVPIGQGKVYCYCDVSADNSPLLQGNDATARLHELLTGFAGPVPAILESFGNKGHAHVAPIEEVHLEEWARGSVLLIGDAAHATSPNMAEGAAMALEDALVLAESLAEGGSYAEAIKRFQARRRPRTQWVLDQTHRRDRTRGLPPGIRNFVLRRWGQNIFKSNYRPLLDLP